MTNKDKRLPQANSPWLVVRKLPQYIDFMRSRWLQGVGAKLDWLWPSRVRAFLPSRCAICQDWPQAPLCEACISCFAQPRHRCSGCALPLHPSAQRCGTCLRTPPPLDLCLAATGYEWPWVDLIARYKFQQQPGWASPLATLMRSIPSAEDALDGADWVLPIPLSTHRLAERGYNQSWLLARQLSPRNAAAHLLLKTCDTPVQSSLPRAERLANLVGAYAVEPLLATRLRGKNLVLIDDVMTSGASLHTAAQVLRQAGAAKVSALVLARTESASEP